MTLLRMNPTVVWANRPLGKIPQVTQLVAMTTMGQPIMQILAPNGCPGPANVCSPARIAIDQAMSVLVGIFTLSMLQNDRLSDIEVRRKQSTPTGVPDAEICRNALATRRVSMQRLAGASDPDDSSYQGECERHLGRRSVCEERHMALLRGHLAPRFVSRTLIRRK